MNEFFEVPILALHHVRGHQNNRKDEFPFNGNHKADELASRAIKIILKYKLIIICMSEQIYKATLFV
jgi:hypothetical protein